MGNTVLVCCPLYRLWWMQICWSGCP